jgi:hypothetical protein
VAASVGARTGGTRDGPAVRPVHGLCAYGANDEEVRVLWTSRRHGARGSWEGAWPRSARGLDAEGARCRLKNVSLCHRLKV